MGRVVGNIFYVICSIQISYCVQWIIDLKVKTGGDGSFSSKFTGFFLPSVNSL